jgi:sugar lactone lactonase YvrE
MAVDGAGNIYVADGHATAIRKVTPTGEVVTIAQVGLDGPRGIALDPAGNIFVADTVHSTILRVSSTGALTVLAGAVNAPGSADGAGADARFNGPRGMVIDARGNLYVADTGNHTIRKITPSGVVTTIAGQAGMSGFRNGSLPGFLQSPAGVALGGNDLVGNDLYITMPTALVVVRNRP